MTQLVRPHAIYKASYIQAVCEFQAERRRSYMDIDISALEADFDAHVAHESSQEPPTPGGVPQTYYWDVDEQGYIGRLSIRHYLNKYLETFGGHIGYDVRPSRRREGHGTRMLTLGLAHARTLGLDRVFITCDEDNVGSQKIIKANGGVLQDVVKLDFRPVPTMRWWIDLNADPT